ncbi:MAG: MFS transporter [Asticcacaulis sp.]
MSWQVTGRDTVGRLGYASGNLGKSVLWSALDYFFLFFLTEIWDLPPDLAGWVIFSAMAWDGLSDPLMGYLADRTWSPLGKYGPYLLFGAPVCAATFWLLFQDPGVRGADAFWIVLGTSLLFRTAYTVCDVPHNALMARIATTPADAAQISGYRFFFSSAGALLVAATIGWTLSESLSEARDRAASVTLLGGLVYVIALWSAWFSVRRLDQTTLNTARTTRLLPALLLSFSNPDLRRVLLTALFQAASLPAFAKGLTYLATYVYQTPAWSGQALMILTLAQALSIPLWMALTRHLSKDRALSLAYGVILAGLVAFVLMAPHPALAPLWLALIGCGLSGANMVLWAMLPDAIHAGETTQGERVEALPTGLFTLMLKVGIGLSALAMGLGLDLIGLKATAKGDPAFGQALPLLMAAIPATGAVLILWMRRLPLRM